MLTHTRSHTARVAGQGGRGAGHQPRQRGAQQNEAPQRGEGHARFEIKISKNKNICVPTAVGALLASKCHSRMKHLNGVRAMNRDLATSRTLSLLYVCVCGGGECAVGPRHPCLQARAGSTCERNSKKQCCGSTRQDAQSAAGATANKQQETGMKTKRKCTNAHIPR